MSTEKMPSDEPIKVGMLFKKGHQRHNWKERFFELSNQKIAYFTSKDKRHKKGELSFVRNGKVLNVNIRITPHGSRKTGNSGASEWRFCISAGGTSLLLAAPTEEHMNEWIIALQRAISCPESYSLTQMSESDLTGGFMIASDDDDGDSERPGAWFGFPMNVQDLMMILHIFVKIEI